MELSSPSTPRKNPGKGYLPEKMEVDPTQFLNFKPEGEKKNKKRKYSSDKSYEKMEAEYLPEEMQEEKIEDIQKQVKRHEEKMEKRKHWKYFPAPDIFRISPPVQEMAKIQDRMFFKPEATSHLVRSLVYHAIGKENPNVCVLQNLPFEVAFDAIEFLIKTYEYFDSKNNYVDVVKNWQGLEMILPENLKKDYTRLNPYLSPFIEYTSYDSDTIYDLLKKAKLDPKIEQLFIFAVMENVFFMAYPYYRNKKFVLTPEVFEKCLINTKIEYMVMPLGYSSHLNVLFIDKKNKTVERFEPYGEIIYSQSIFPESQTDIDQSIEDYFKNYLYKYYSPQSFCPREGIQYKMEKLQDSPTTKYGTSGFCVSWSYLFALSRLKYPNESNETIAKNLMKRIEKIAKKKYMDKKLPKIDKKSYLQKDFILEFIYEYMSSIFSTISDEIKYINTRFHKINLKLEDRVLIF